MGHQDAQAVIQRLGREHTVSPDRDFDRIPSVTRLDPLSVGESEDLVLAGGS